MFKIYNYTKNVEPINFDSPPYDVDFTILGLHKKRTFNKGELIKTEYYGNFDGTNYTDLVAVENRVYYRVNRMVHRREVEIHWIKNEGLNYTGGTGTTAAGDIVGAIKNTTKYYTPNESVAAGERRRRTIISNVKIYTLYLLQVAAGNDRETAETLGFSFLSEYANEIGLYIEGVLDPLKNGIMTCDHHDWLDVPIDQNGTRIRDYLYNEINIDYTENNIDI